MLNDLFGDFIGQKHLKAQLNFLLDSHRKNKIFNPSLIVGKRGDGKSKLARTIGQNILNNDNTEPRRFIEINSSSVTNITGFVDEIVIPHLSGNAEVTLFCDEISAMDSKVKDWLLSVLQPNANNQTFAHHAGIRHDFSFKHFSFIAATTDPQALSEPFKSRLRRLEFEPYSLSDLRGILYKQFEKNIFKDDVDKEIVTTVRGSPRNVVMLAGDILKYLSRNNKSSFGRADWQEFVEIFDILPMGLTQNELMLLRYLVDAPLSLTGIAARFNLRPSMVRAEIELFPLSQNLITIDQKRKLTQKGRKLLQVVGDKN